MMSASSPDVTVVLRDAVDGQAVALQEPEVLIAGYTARDATTVQAHIDELAAFGIDPPDSVPSFYRVPSELLVCAPAMLRVSHAATCGECEPVLVVADDDRMYLGVGSDHTDREIERQSVAASKRACPKVIGSDLWPLEQVEDDWDEMMLQARTGETDALYQRGALALLRPPREVLALARRHREHAGRPLVLFLGTVPLVDGSFRFERRFRAVLEDQQSGRTLECAYEVQWGPAMDDDAGLAVPRRAVNH